ncbi:MAG: site-specific integrase, partial [Rikenellaceae bacterium]
INEKKRIGKIGIAEAYQSTLRSLQRYIGEERITFDDINLTFLRSYENFLISTGAVQNTINYYMRNLRTIYNRASDDGIISHQNNPFHKYSIRNVKTVKRALKKDEVRRIAHLDLYKDPQLEEARDFFMFSFYTQGMAPIDILYLRHTDIIDNVIYYQRHKTQQPIQIAITEPIQKLLNKYNIDQEFVLPMINRNQMYSLRKRYKSAYSQINYHLKKVAALANINTTLTAYVARHSWASIAKEDGAPTAVLSEGLG